MLAAMAAMATMHTKSSFNSSVKLKDCHKNSDQPQHEDISFADEFDFFKRDVHKVEDISVQRPTVPMPPNFKEWVIDGVRVWAATKKAAVKKAKKMSAK